MGWSSRGAAVSVLLAMEEHRRAVGLRIKKIRESKGLSQEDVAHNTGVSVKTLSRWETGRHAGYASNLNKLAAALDVLPEDIVGPPPAPLGLGHELTSPQLDRIEEQLAKNYALLKEIRALMPTPSPEVQLNEWLDEAEEDQRHNRDKPREDAQDDDDQQAADG